MLDLTHYQALTFDCYGTLIDWEQGIIEATRACWPTAAPVPADGAILDAFSRFEHGNEAGDPAPLYPEVLRRTMLDMQAALGVSKDPARAVKFAASVPDWPAFPDSAAALARLRRRYPCMAILSNIHLDGIAASRRRLSGTAGDPFDFVITAEETGTYKPHLRHFERARDRLAAAGIAPDRWLHVAQSLFHDHAPAKQLGLASVWIDRRAQKPGSGATPVETNASYALRFASMGEFAAAVEQAFGAD